MTEATDWKSKIPEEIRATPLVQEATDEAKFWKRVLDQHSYAGQSIRIPGDDASEEQKGEFRAKLRAKVPSLMEVPSENDDLGYEAALSKLGRPEKADDYALPDSEFSFSPEQAAHLREVAATAGMTRRQFRNLAKKYAENASHQVAAIETERKANDEALQREWGVAAEEKYAQVLAFAKQNGAPDHFVRALEGRGAKAAEVLWMHKIMGAGKEGSTVAGQGNTVASGNAKLTPYEAKMKLDEIYGNPSHPFHRGDRTAQARVMELVSMENPG